MFNLFFSQEKSQLTDLSTVTFLELYITAETYNLSMKFRTWVTGGLLYGHLMTSAGLYI